MSIALATGLVSEAGHGPGQGKRQMPVPEQAKEQEHTLLNRTIGLSLRRRAGGLMMYERWQG